jgi:hypothetical protein
MPVTKPPYSTMKKIIIPVLLVFIIAAGVLLKHHVGTHQTWYYNASGGILYELFWCLAVRLFFQKAGSAGIAVAVFALTCLLELLQTWHPPFLEEARSGYVGRVLLGTTFNPVDFFWYAVGSLLGWGLLAWIKRTG